MKIRKKPIVVDAWIIDTMEMQYNGAMPSWVYRAWKEDKVIGMTSDGHDLLVRIKTPEGIMTAHEGDVLVKGAKGELYSIKRSIFEETYDVVDAENKVDPTLDFEYDTGRPYPPANPVVVESIEDQPDGSAIVRVDMDYETMKTFAKLGLHHAIVAAAEKIVKEHGDD